MNANDGLYAVSELFCTICNHDLNHTSYRICVHPILDVPLCVICHDDIHKSGKSSNGIIITTIIIYYTHYHYTIELITSTDPEVLQDLCSWCADGGNLHQCDNNDCNSSSSGGEGGGGCNLNWCSDCISNNINDDELKKIDECDQWNCFKCQCKFVVVFVCEYVLMMM